MCSSYSNWEIMSLVEPDVRVGTSKNRKIETVTSISNGRFGHFMPHTNNTFASSFLRLRCSSECPRQFESTLRRAQCDACVPWACEVVLIKKYCFPLLNAFTFWISNFCNFYNSLSGFLSTEWMFARRQSCLDVIQCCIGLDTEILDKKSTQFIKWFYFHFDIARTMI